MVLQFVAKFISFRPVVGKPEFGEFVDDVGIVPVVDVHETSLSHY